MTDIMKIVKLFNEEIQSDMIYKVVYCKLRLLYHICHSDS